MATLPATTQSPFPHMQAAAERAQAVAQAAKVKDEEARERLKTWCWRSAILVFCLISAAFAYKVFMGRRPGRLQYGWERAGEYSDSQMVRRANAAQNSDRFFLEISNSAKRVWSSVQGNYLEKLGWGGICAVPFEDEIDGRTCKVVALAVGDRDGLRVPVPDCSRNTRSIKGLMNTIFESTCPQVNATTVSFSNLLEIIGAPKVIDYISLDSQDYVDPDVQSQFSIVKSFPFSERCARTWQVQINDAHTRASISSLLEVRQGCRIVSAGSALFARCPCVKAEADKTVHKTKPSENSLNLNIMSPHKPQPEVTGLLNAPHLSHNTRDNAEKLQIHPSGTITVHTGV